MHSHRSLDIIERHRVHLKDFSFSDGYAGAFHADMVELADTPDLGSGAKACRFKSCYPYQLQTAQQCGLFDFYDILTVDKTVTVYRS